MIERTFVMLKPGTLQRRIVGDVIRRFERKGLKITALKLLMLNRALAENHYHEHKGRDYYEALIDYSLSGPVIAMVLEGDEAVPMVRKMAGPVTLSDQQAGTIRGDYAACTRLNIIHSSDSVQNAAREIALFFNDTDISSWEDGNTAWY